MDICGHYIMMSVHIYLCILEEMFECIYIVYIIATNGYIWSNTTRFNPTLVKSHMGQISARQFSPVHYHICIRVNPLMPSGAFNICCPRDAVSRTANVERTVRH